MAPVIEAKSLTKIFPSKQGVRGLNLDVEAGEIFGYLGPNGSGKTTTIRLMLGLTRPDKGEVRLFGKRVTTGSTGQRASIGFVPAEIALPESTNANRLLRYYERLSGRPAKMRAELCRELNLADRDMNRPIRTLSRGTKQKIAIIQALQHDPELLILDEPTSGLDPLSQEAFFDVLHDFRDRGRTVFFSSHILAEVQRLCDRVAVLREGNLVLQSTMMEMASRADRLLWVKLNAEVSEPPPEIHGARFIRRDSGGWLLYLVRSNANGQILQELVRLQPLDFRLEPALEESFLQLYGVKIRSLAEPGLKA